MRFSSLTWWPVKQGTAWLKKKVGRRENFEDLIDTSTGIWKDATTDSYSLKLKFKSFMELFDA
jgi:hypothetical protein